MSQAREQLGIRSEHAVRREMQQTEAAYNRLARAGLASSRELARAKDAEIKKLRELRNELKGAKDGYSGLNRLMTATAGIAAGGYVIKRAADQAMSFDERLAGMANTAFSGRDLAGKQRGMKELEAIINRSVQSGVGGGTRDQAAEALDALIAKGTLGYDRSIKFLPTVMRTATGANANALDIANLSSVLVGQGIVSNDRELKTALNMVTASGQAGGFEIKDQAKWLAQQLPLAGKSGMLGLNGLQKVLTMNQAAILTSGTTDEAGNNVRNLLAKLSSSDTAKDFEKQTGTDLTGFLMKKRMQGVDAVDAWMGLIDKEAAKNPQLKAAITKLQSTKDRTQQEEILKSITALSEGTTIGKYFQDMQAVGALMGMRNKSVVDRVNTEVSKNRTEFGANDSNYAFMQTIPSVKVRAAEQAAAAAQKTAMDELTPTIGKVADNFEELATKHPFLLGAGTLATAGLTAVATASGLASLALGTSGASGLAGVASTITGSLSGLARVVPLAAAAFAGFQFGDKVINPAIEAFDKKTGLGIGNGIGFAAASLMLPFSEEARNAVMQTFKTEPAKVETTVKVQLADGLKATSQTTNTAGPVKNWVQTGSVWGIP